MLQTEIAELEHTRESMARELVNLSTKNDELQEQLTEYPELKEAHQVNLECSLSPVKH